MSARSGLPEFRQVVSDNVSDPLQVRSVQSEGPALNIPDRRQLVERGVRFVQLFHHSQPWGNQVSIGTTLP